MNAEQNIYVYELRHPTESQLNAIVDICVKAYSGDIAAKIFTGGDSSLDEPMWRAMICAGFHSGAVYVSSNSSILDPIMSIGVWFGPGNVLYATEEQRALGFTKFFCQIAPEYQQWIIEDFGPKTRQFKSRVLGPTTERDSWYCNIMATHPAYQQQGLGSAIIKAVCARAAMENVPLCLGTQSDSNAAFYRGLGLHEVGRMDELTPWGLFTGNMFILNSPKH
ncbi:uncharacterized protein C8R40DRAFT_1128092 [Lentinula edodes]|uniref:uncharacterized protein n=1 Tax=Lentinula edodes TaxID=5353 RepID=UPI001E8DFAC0|nr:uncharacterized protein C8R40DRAFT_1128092 [Lentinula edodes]KAH7870128.1 hypothetical protein C8R40DRAFT_1128092 [Lentinula edodes]